MKVTFKGGKELEAAIKELGLSVAKEQGHCRRALDKAAQPIRDEWVRGVDVKKGVLRRSIQTGERATTKAVRRFRRGSDTVERYIGIDASEDLRLAANKGSPGYASIEEFGIEGHAANPAGRNAWEGQKQAALDRLADDLRIEIARAAKIASRKARK